MNAGCRHIMRGHVDLGPSVPRYAPKDAKKGGLVAKGAAPSKDLVRMGIENVLKEVLGHLASLDHYEHLYLDLESSQVLVPRYIPRTCLTPIFEGKHHIGVKPVLGRYK